MREKKNHKKKLSKIGQVSGSLYFQVKSLKNLTTDRFTQKSK